MLLDGRRHLTCLALAVSYDGSEIVTASDGGDGAEEDDALHPVQRAFLDHDGYQCGYCTPGQVCSAVGMLEELKEGDPSHVTEDLEGPPEATDEDPRADERQPLPLRRVPRILAAVVRAAGGVRMRELEPPALGDAAAAGRGRGEPGAPCSWRRHQPGRPPQAGRHRARACWST